LDLTSDSVPVEDPTKSKCCAISEWVACRCVGPGDRSIRRKVLFLVGLSACYIPLKCCEPLAHWHSGTSEETWILNCMLWKPQILHSSVLISQIPVPGSCPEPTTSSSNTAHSPQLYL
jgi:hypothetical protein